MNLKRIIGLTAFLFSLITIVITPVYGTSTQSWHQFVQTLRSEAIGEGIRPALFDRLFTNMTPNFSILRYDRNQPEMRQTFLQYRTQRASKKRIREGVRKLQQHYNLLNQIGNEYGVNPCVIVALWGLESNYGTYTGNFHVIRSLATLAYDGRRSAFFRRELLQALRMVNDGHIRANNFKGEWAGASGQPQFLPSSWAKYAVDQSGDGKKDIWHTYSDIFASMANYLKSNGWQNDQPVLAEVSVPQNFPQNLVGINVTKTVAEWQQLGVSMHSNHQAISSNAEASIVRPEGGPDLMVFDNFRALRSWNRSAYYDATVSYVADRICQLRR